MKIFLLKARWFFWAMMCSTFVFYKVMVGYSKFICYETSSLQYSNNIASVVEKIDRRDGEGALIIIENISRHNGGQRCPEVDFLGMLLGASVYILNPHGVMVVDEDRNKELSHLKGVAEKLIVIKNK